jgi:Glycosyl hydrolases family 18
MRRMLRTFAALLLVGSLGVATPAAGAGLAAGRGPAGSGAGVAPAVAGGMQVYGAWHCGNDACTWSTVRDMANFDANNHWLIDRGNGQPSVNLVILSFVNPLKLENQTTDAGDTLGVPKGMTSAVVQYFTSHGIRVMLSIGGITYTNDWDTALAANPAQLGRNAAALAQQLGVGIEIDYENANSPNLIGLQTFISTYRSLLPYDATGTNPAARLTIDLAAGDRWLIGIAQKATADWLNTTSPVLDYANAMVPSRQPTASGAEGNWQEHLDGKSNYNPPIPPLAPAKFTGSLYIAEGSKVRPECNNFSASLQNATGSWVQSAAPNGAGTTTGLLGYMFWAAEMPSTRGVTTSPPNTCEGGVGAGATAYQIPIPMPALRQS